MKGKVSYFINVLYCYGYDTLGGHDIHNDIHMLSLLAVCWHGAHPDVVRQLAKPMLLRLRHEYHYKGHECYRDTLPPSLLYTLDNTLHLYMEHYYDN